jgi:catechol 2,3-dioxygenase-like lactoylglutathione lyase family enzyme
MTTLGVEAVFLQTHNWGRMAKFFLSLGYELEFETGHDSGQFRNGDGPYVFVAEVPADQETALQLVLAVPDGGAVDPALDVVTPFRPTHWGTREAVVRDPDGRTWSLQAPGEA